MTGIKESEIRQGREKGNAALIAELAAALAAIVLLASCAATSTDDRPVTLSYDGLTPIEDTLMTQVWVREGYSLAQYSKVMLLGAGIQYRPHRPDHPEDGFPITEEQKQAFETLITEEFDRALERLTLPQVDAPGPDVLLVRGTMLDVISRVPPSGAGPGRLDSVGQATFVVELIDSESNTVLVRALDTRAAALPGGPRGPDDTANQTAVRNLIGRWADLLVDALNDLASLDTLQGA